MRAKGMLIKCDRCGATHFSKYIGESETYEAHARWDKFELAEDWESNPEIGDLCPKCRDRWENLKRRFLQGGQE